MNEPSHQRSAFSSQLSAGLRRAKFVAFVLLVFAFGFGAGCATTAKSGTSEVAIIETILDAVLPATFRGDAHVIHKNGYFNFNIHAGDLRKEDGRWQWKW